MLPDCVATTFEGFGPCRLMPETEPRLWEIDIPRDRRSARRLIRWHCPAAPGVYGMIDAEGQLIYVGKSKALRSRLLGHFASAPAESKSQRIVEHTRRLVWERWPHEFPALLRELELIRRWRPRFNVQGDPHRARRTFLCLGREPAPYARLSDHPAAFDGDRFGPIRAGRRTRDLVKVLNNHFGLRDCPHRSAVVFADQGQLFDHRRGVQCMRYDLGHCAGPCGAVCTRAEYDDRVRAARDFLRGRSGAFLRGLEEAMRRAAAAGQYERAAALRNGWQDLSELDDRLRHMRRVRRRFSFVYLLHDHSAPAPEETWCLVRRGDVPAAVSAPRDRRSRKRCLELIDAIYPGGRSSGALDAEDWDVVLLVAAWFRRHPGELEQTLTPNDARARCR